MKTRSSPKRIIRATACRDCGRPFGDGVERDVYIPGRCTGCAKAARREANRRSYVKHNRHRLGKPHGPQPGSCFPSVKMTQDELQRRIAEATSQESLGPRALPQTCEFCARLEYLHNNHKEQFCPLRARGEPCDWIPRYKVDDGDEPEVGTGVHYDRVA